MSIQNRVVIPPALYARLETAAKSKYLKVHAFIALALTEYLGGEVSTPSTAKVSKTVATNPAYAHLSPQARAALTRKEAKEAEEAELKAKRIETIRMQSEWMDETFEGCEVYRPYITEGWTPENPGEGYYCVRRWVEGKLICVRVPEGKELTPVTVVIKGPVKRDVPEGLLEDDGTEDELDRYVPIPLDDMSWDEDDD